MCTNIMQYAIRVVYCVGMVHNMLSGSILCRLDTQYARRGSILCWKLIVALLMEHKEILSLNFMLLYSNIYMFAIK